MALFSFYNVRRPRQYNHQPIYFDPRKEALDERVNKIKKEMGMEIPPEDYKPQIKGSFIQGTTHLRKRTLQGESNRSRTYKSMKLLGFLAVLLMLFWYLFFK